MHLQIRPAIASAGDNSATRPIIRLLLLLYNDKSTPMVSPSLTSAPTRRLPSWKINRAASTALETLITRAVLFLSIYLSMSHPRRSRARRLFFSFLLSLSSPHRYRSSRKRRFTCVSARNETIEEFRSLAQRLRDRWPSFEITPAFGTIEQRWRATKGNRFIVAICAAPVGGGIKLEIVVFENSIR